MSIPLPPSKGALLPHDATLDEPTLADYAALGWVPVDIRTQESSLETCRLVLLGLRMGTVSLDKAQMEALELEIRVNGGFTAKAGENLEGKGGRKDLPKTEIDFLSNIPASKPAQEAAEAAKKPKDPRKTGRPKKSAATEPKGSALQAAIASQLSKSD